MNPLPLAGLDVVITRPEDLGRRLRESLSKLGATGHLLPMMQITALTSPEQCQRIKNCILGIDQYQKVIFISQNAVAHARDWLDQYWPQLPTTIEYFAIGAATAKLAEEAGMKVSHADQAMNSETLLASSGLQHVSSEKILIFRGLGGRTHLADTLSQRGASVTYCELYQRDIPAGAAANLRKLHEAFGANTVLSVHSGESLENLASLLQSETLDDWMQHPILVPGERVASIARQCGFVSIIVADNATDPAMTSALQRWYAGFKAD